MGRALRGRPLASSPEMLQDAALELFVENTYAKTTIDQITQRAGVSRATFFNYFASKSDVLWLDLDQALERLGQELSARASSGSPSARLGLEKVEEALLAAAAELGADQVPLALTQYELVGSVQELQASAIARLSDQANIITAFLTGYGMSPARARAAAYACMAAVISGAQEWASAGPQRDPLQGFVREAVVPIISGFVVSET